jgi:hypothetical protein
MVQETLEDAGGRPWGKRPWKEGSRFSSVENIIVDNGEISIYKREDWKICKGYIMATMFLSVSRGIVIGFRFFLDFIFIGILYHELAKRHFWRRLKNEAKAMGLRFKQAEAYHEFGLFHDKHNGYRTEIRIDSSGSITTGVYIEIESSKGIPVNRLELNPPQPSLRPSKDEQDFSTNNALFDRIFKTRRGDKETAARMIVSHELLDAFVHFYVRWMFRLHYLRIDIPHRLLQCKLNYGNAWTAYIPPRALSEILSDLYSLIGEFERVFKKE